MFIASYFMSRLYDASMKKMETASLAAWRRELLAGVSGDVIEIGSGTGVNLPYYDDRVTSLTLTEPDRHMANILRNKLVECQREETVLHEASAEALPFDNDRFDAAVVTLVLCSVDDQIRALREIRRVLKPRGRIHFIEHVLAKHRPALIKWQRLLQPVWVCACGNCHLTHDTGSSIEQAGFVFERLDHRISDGCPSVVSPCICGMATAR